MQIAARHCFEAIWQAERTHSEEAAAHLGSIVIPEMIRIPKIASPFEPISRLKRHAVLHDLNSELEF
jgi:hypothetical protein